MELRPYQREAVGAALSAIRCGRHPVISLPTGAGKSLCIAALAEQMAGRLLVASHRRELLEQDYSALNRFAPHVSAGIYSAGLGRRDTDQKVIFGGIQSVYKRMDDLQAAGRFVAVLVDEAHLVSRDTCAMYSQVMASVPDAARVGLTATPYRLDSGLLHEGEDAWFDDLCIHVKPTELVPQYLSPLIGVGTNQELQTDGVRIKAGEFVASELSQLACDEGIVRAATVEMLRLAQWRRSGLAFCVDVAHAEAMTGALRERGETARLVTGKTPGDERAGILAEFKAGCARWLVNVNVLTTGFDHPAIDCIAVLRPTMSKALHVQIMGRGMRKSESKQDCLVLDFAGNIKRHGSIDMLAEYRHSQKDIEQEERERNAAERAKARELTHSLTPAAGDPMSGALSEEIKVHSVRYQLERSRKYEDRVNLVAVYRCERGITARQWVCIEYPGGARWHAEQWFKRRGLVAPAGATEAMSVAQSAPTPESLSVAWNGRYPEVKIEHFGSSDDGFNWLEAAA